MPRSGNAGNLPPAAALPITALLALAMTLTAILPGASSAAAQELPTEVPSSPAAVEPTPAAQAAVAPAEFAAGAPHLQTVAQGLIGIEGPVVWRVRELGLSSTGAPESASSSFTLQRTGAAIIRNELTSRRSRLEPGEAFFMASGDPFLRYAVGSDPSIIWVVELLPQDAAAPGTSTTGTVLFTSDAINDYPRGTFDAELQRGVLLPGEVSELPPHTGPALVMVTSGRIQASADGGQPAAIGAGSGRLVTGALTLRNGDTQPAAFVIASLGEPVDGAEQPAAAAQTAPTPAPGQPVPTVLLPPVDAAQETVPPTPVPEVVTEPTPAPTQPAAPAPAEGDTDGDGWSDAEEIAYGSDPLNRDYDGDGLLDGEEIYVYGTDPLNNDSDGDGLVDGEEVYQYGSGPLATDSDGDGLGDADELFVYGTNPAAFDTDGDGIGDGEEVFSFGTNPLDPASGP
jgi:hypothetical protein